MQRLRFVSLMVAASLGPVACNCQDPMMPSGTGGGSAGGATAAAGGRAGGSTAGGAAAGGSTGGGSTGGGSTGGGSTAGGSTAGGSTAGGSTAGGSTAGGSTAGGSTAGGSTAGGSTAGGSTAGGSTAGGSTAGGSTAGGSTAGGSTAGGAATDGGVDIGCAVVVPIRHDAGTYDGLCGTPLGSLLPVPTVPALIYGDNRTGFDTQVTCNFATNGSERNYLVTVPSSGELTIELENLSADAGFVPAVGLYADCSFNQGYPFACLAGHVTERRTKLVIPTIDAGTYLLAVDSMTPEPGDYAVSLCLRQPSSAPLGDTCSNPAPLVTTDNHVFLEANNTGLRDDVTFIKDNGVQCRGGSFAGPLDRVYALDLPDAGPGGLWDVQARAWSLTTNGTEPIIVFTDVCPASGTTLDAGVIDCGSGSGVLAGSPVGSNLTHRMPAGRHYVWVELLEQRTDPYQASYALDVRYAKVGSVANDLCGPTAPLLQPNTSYAGTLVGATSQLDNAVCADSSGQLGQGAEVFYRYTAPATGTATFEIQGERATTYFAGLFTGCQPTDCLTMRNPNGLLSRTTFSFAVTQGTTYVLMVEEYDYNTLGNDPGDGFRGAFGVRVSQ